MGRLFCVTCESVVPTELDEANGFECCTQCGRVFHEHVFSTDPTFSKTPGGQSTVDGNFVPESGVVGSALTRGPRGSRVFGYQVDSHEKTVGKGRHEISQIAERLGMRPREELVGAAHRLYKLAVQRNFTRGRRTNQVAGSCLYIVCRQEDKPYMLIDFSDALQTNVYLLGSVFLQLCKLLRLESHPVIRRPVDPSLYIHRFADKLGLPTKRAHHLVVNTALRLVASMKRDWMQTGRRPSGVCGAALFVAAQMHGNINVTKKDVVSIVHVGEGTLNRRLTEFEQTPSWDMTMDEFETRALEYEEEQRKLLLEEPQAPSTSGGLSSAAAAMATAAGAGAPMPRLTLGAPPPMSSSAAAQEAAHAQAQALALEVGSAEPNAQGAIVPYGGGGGDVDVAGAGDGVQVLQCIHANTPGAVPFKHGMCKQCFEEFLVVSGGVSGTGLDPPAMKPELYQSKKRRRPFKTNPDVLPPPPPPPPIATETGTKALALCAPTAVAAAAAAAAASGQATTAHGAAIAFPPPPPPLPPRSSDRARPNRRDNVEREMDEVLRSVEMRDALTEPSPSSQTVRAAAQTAVPVVEPTVAPPTQTPATQPASHTIATQPTQPVDATIQPTDEAEVDTLSDLDDEDIAQYINTKEEAVVKTEIWTKLNADWAAAQEEKKKAAELAGDSGARASSRKRKKPSEMEGIAPLPRPGRPAATAAEAARSMAAQRKLSSKINYAALDSLFIAKGAGGGASTSKVRGGGIPPPPGESLPPPPPPLMSNDEAFAPHFNAAAINARRPVEPAGGRGRGRGGVVGRATTGPMGFVTNRSTFQ